MGWAATWRCVSPSAATTYKEPPKFTVTNLIAEGDFVTALGEITLKGEDAKETDYSYCDVWRFRDGKMVELKAFVIKIQIEDEATNVEQAIG